ncbi:DUF1759 domain-containing protein [Streptococcus dysgalactiae subsp. equisimilis]|nr:DUF1759 domain-containing protein [Streptococcus dysgalactiae]MBM6549254.1 DUF1759 domain-containing protein [Streptococcus dysgalactiae subsp. equisimilis]
MEKNESSEPAGTDSDMAQTRQVSHLDSLFHGSNVIGSSRSKRGNKSKRLLAELRARHLQESYEFEVRSLEERHRHDLLKAQHELELAKLTEELSVNGSSCSSVDSDHHERVRQFVLGSPVKEMKLERHEDKDTGRMEKGTDIGSIQTALAPMLAGLDLPKVELLAFEGSSSTYWKFIKQFDYYVAPKVKDEGQRLLYLLHYCRGRAREAIEECIMLPSSSGYRRAREILKNLFGQRHVVARALLDDLLKGSDFSLHKSEALSRLAVKMENCAIALEQMDYTADLNALVTIERIVRSLPGYLQHQWAEVVDKITLNSREPNFKDLTEFIASKARVARSRFGQLASGNSSRASVGSSSHNHIRGNTKLNCTVTVDGVANATTEFHCGACAAPHALVECPKFLAMAVAERWTCAKDKGLCFACLKGSHRVRDCKKPATCNINGCKRRHHGLLHYVKEKPNSPLHVASGQSIATKPSPGNVLLGLVPVKLRINSQEIKGYAFLDNGSDTTLIREDAAKVLGINSRADVTTIKTVGGLAHSTKRVDRFEVVSADGTGKVVVEDAVVVRQLPLSKPSLTVKQQVKKWPHLSELPFSDVHGGEVLVLIGCDVPEAHWTLDQRLGGRKQPYAVKTLLGWVALGPQGGTTRRLSSVNCTVSNSQLLLNQLRQLYDSDFTDVQAPEKALSAEDLAALRKVEQGTTFQQGRYTVPMPWRPNAQTGSGNFKIAQSRLRSLEQKLRRDESLLEKYRRTMQQNLEKGYAIRVPKEYLCPDYHTRWYLPHHAVINPKKPDKLRVVLDCAAKYNGRSLNDLLYQGPDTTSDLVSILLRFRREGIAVVADVEEMFMQVNVAEEDRGALRYLWWPDGKLDERPIECQMTRHPFGATSSPFCANFALRRTARDFGIDYDRSVVEAVEKNFYVDDCLISFAKASEAIRFSTQLNELTRRGGFKLKKWVTNSNEVRQSLPGSDAATITIPIPALQQETQRALGLEWNVKNDTLVFRFQMKDKPSTRRGVLSIVSSIFDPLGLNAPFCLPAKQLLQKVCKAKVGWDQLLPPEDLASWEKWVAFVHRLDEVRIKRCIRKDDRLDVGQIELHIFCDASESGYGAVAYARCVPRIGDPYLVLLFSKSRVAPIKTVTIPRLELAAAVLGVRVSEVVRKGMPNFFAKTYFWTDSMIVLYYIRNVNTRFSTFVANRLAVIHQFCSVHQWQHIASGQNPADYSSRGITSERDLTTWTQGPALFCTRNLPTEPPLCLNDPPKEIELKNSPAHVVGSQKGFALNSLLAKYSEWTRLLRAIAWLIRFVHYVQIMFEKRQNGSLKVGDLSVAELELSKMKILTMVQEEAYGSIISQLKGNIDRVRLASCALSRLCPILLDELLCVGGRLRYSEYPTAFKHPIILPNRHVVTDLIIQYYHQSEGHSGPSHVLAAIRECYWIVKGASAVKRVIGKCMACRRASATAGQQMMAPLPLCRVQQGWACFTTVGTDLFGPFSVRRGRSMEKRYGCVFTCLQTRAVHLEIVASLSTDSFIMALMRFIGRRGKPNEIYSDNGSNFIGAISELREHVERWDTRKINRRMASRGIQWHFNPPASSHRGGIWERVIRSVRRILFSVAAEQITNDETLSTYFVEVERILNNRPIVPLLTSDKDSIALTPNDLLLLRDNEGIPVDASVSDTYSRRWKQVNYLAEVFWRRWIREYLPTLQTRQKWLSKGRNFKRNDIVLVLSSPTPRGRWPMGIIESCVEDSDGLVRTVTVRMKDGMVERDVRKVCLLEGTD